MSETVLDAPRCRECGHRQDRHTAVGCGVVEPAMSPRGRDRVCKCMSPWGLA